MEDKKEYIIMRENLVKYWWVFLLRGILGVLFGIAAFVWPGLTLMILVIFFGTYCLVEGIASLIGALGSKRWGLHLFHGLISIGAGLVTLLWPAITGISLIMIIGIWAMIGGASEVIAAIQLRKEIENEWLLGLSGLISVLFGLFVFLAPGAGALALVWMIAFYAVFVGLLMIGLGIRLHGLK